MDVVLRSAAVFVLTRAVGRRELSSLELFDMILLIVIGDMIQQGVTQSDSPTGADRFARRRPLGRAGVKRPDQLPDAVVSSVGGCVGSSVRARSPTGSIGTGLAAR